MSQYLHVFMMMTDSKEDGSLYGTEIVFSEIKVTDV